MRGLKWILLFLVLVLVSCARPHPTPKDPEAALLARVKAYWDLRLKGGSAEERLKFERCGLDPKCREAFLQGKPKATLTYLSYQILGVEHPDEKTAMVKIKVRYRVPPILGQSFEQTGTFKDKWVLINGKWYHVIKGFSREW